ncbi:hypothetical protein EST38_g12909 [Candolleomyces aberdarensis]|uniref:Uncharacterized protein n=1 Tax=Candolleomyces aberdarensis TaxID=2316362 RepID=A0A4Q2D484_9AGAR|nr:hypothetical protein EST38_g12909 [Candolleomyces aberdarensis]
MLVLPNAHLTYIPPAHSSIFDTMARGNSKEGSSRKQGGGSGGTTRGQGVKKAKAAHAVNSRAKGNAGAASAKKGDILNFYEAELQALDASNAELEELLPPVPAALEVDKWGFRPA